jgi:hypothetical protein
MFEIRQFLQGINPSCVSLAIPHSHAHFVSGAQTMRWALIVSAGVITALVIGAEPAFAFQETPAAPPPDAMQVAPALNLQGPATGPAQPAEKSGKVFGFSALPKLDFGLELLYSDQPLALQRDTTLPEGAIPDDSDVTVLGKVKRHF